MGDYAPKAGPGAPRCEARMPGQVCVCGMAPGHAGKHGCYWDRSYPHDTWANSNPGPDALAAVVKAGELAGVYATCGCQGGYKCLACRAAKAPGPEAGRDWGDPSQCPRRTCRGYLMCVECREDLAASGILPVKGSNEWIYCGKGERGFTCMAVKGHDGYHVAYYLDSDGFAIVWRGAGMTVPAVTAGTGPENPSEISGE